jgi:hypothetical protein
MLFDGFKLGSLLCWFWLVSKGLVYIFGSSFIPPLLEVFEGGRLFMTLVFIFISNIKKV